MTADNQFIVMTACAKMPTSCWGKYHKVAVVETNGDRVPKQIHPRHKSVRRIVWVRDALFSGKTSRCAYQIALRRAHEIAEEMETLQSQQVFHPVLSRAQEIYATGSATPSLYGLTGEQRDEAIGFCLANGVPADVVAAQFRATADQIQCAESRLAY